MDPDYTELSGAVNLSVNGLGHLGESGKVFTPLISSSSGSLNSSSWSSSPLPAAPVGLVVGHSGLGESIRSTGVTSSLGESHSFPQSVPNTILDGLRSLNRTVEELYHRISHQEPRSIVPLLPSPQPQPPIINQPPVINIFTQVPGISPAVPAVEDPVLAGGIAAALLIFLLLIGALLLRRFSPDRWKVVRDALMRILRMAAVPFAWLLHRLGDVAHRFGSLDGETNSVSTYLKCFPWIVCLNLFLFSLVFFSCY
jgi:hypothetical protein